MNYGSFFTTDMLRLSNVSVIGMRLVSRGLLGALEIGATWTAAMRNLMLAAFAAYVLALFAFRGYGNAGLWIAYLIFMAIRGLGQAALYPRLLRRAFH